MVEPLNRALAVSPGEIGALVFGLEQVHLHSELHFLGLAADGFQEISRAPLWPGGSKKNFYAPVAFFLNGFGEAACKAKIIVGAAVRGLSYSSRALFRSRSGRPE